MPVAVYLWVFGVTISTDHTRWAEFGSAMGGIYAPVIALFTLLVLRRQVLLQAQMNKHQFDQAYLQQARADIEFYSTQMSQVMDSIALPGKTLRDLLNDRFQPFNIAELDSENLRELAANIHALIPQSLDIWLAIYPIFTGLDSSVDMQYVMTSHSSKQKLIALLSFKSCVALDNLHRVRTEGKFPITYCFSSLLMKT